MSSDVSAVTAMRLTNARARGRGRTPRAAYGFAAAGCFANDNATKSTNARTRNAS
jgi:hypothetical protein